MHATGPEPSANRIVVPVEPLKSTTFLVHSWWCHIANRQQQSCCIIFITHENVVRYNFLLNRLFVGTISRIRVYAGG